MLDYNSPQETQSKGKQAINAILNASATSSYYAKVHPLSVDIKNTSFDLIFDLQNFHIGSSFNLFSSGSLVHNRRNVIFQGDFDLYRGNMKKDCR